MAFLFAKNYRNWISVSTNLSATAAFAADAKQTNILKNAE